MDVAIQYYLAVEMDQKMDWVMMMASMIEKD